LIYSHQLSSSTNHCALGWVVAGQVYLSKTYWTVTNFKDWFAVCNDMALVYALYKSAQSRMLH